MSFLLSIFVNGPLILASTIVFGTVSVLTSLVDAHGRRQHAISRTWASLLLRIAGVTVRIRGMENVDPARNYVFAGNHLSLFDTPVVLSNIPQQFVFLVAARYVAIPFLGTHLRRSGHFSVDHQDTRAMLKVMTEASKRIRDRGLSVLLFPEGSRARGQMMEFKEGAAYIAIKSQTPVIPFALRGTREVLPVGSLHLRGLPVDFVIGPAIPVDGLTLKDREQLTALMRERVVSLIESMENQPAPAER
jgi:1-acyl-sn-glycerol-3-phosphate acyltransferase